MNITVLVSGNGGNLQFLYYAAEMGLLNDVNFSVIADRSCGAVEFAKAKNLSNHIIDYSRDSNEGLLRTLAQENSGCIITNWHKIIDQETVKKYEHCMINLHYSLLPSFRGLIGVEPIRKAIEMNCRFTGVTCHYVNPDVDAGEIIAQAVVPTDDVFDVIVNNVFQKGCFILLDSILRMRSLTKVTHDDCTYCPRLSFDPKIFDEHFWNLLKK